jgi:hypothetical protein
LFGIVSSLHNDKPIVPIAQAPSGYTAGMGQRLIANYQLRITHRVETLWHPSGAFVLGAIAPKQI